MDRSSVADRVHTPVKCRQPREQRKRRCTPLPAFAFANTYDIDSTGAGFSAVREYSRVEGDPRRPIHSPLLLRDAGVPDDARPARDLRADEFVELLPAGRRGRNHHLRQALLNLGQAQYRGDVCMQLVQQRHGCAGRCSHPIPGIHLESGNARFLHCRHVRQLRDALCARDRKRAQASGLDGAYQRRDVGEIDRDLTADGIGDPVRRDPVGNVHDIEIHLQFQQLHRELRRGADDRGGIAELAGVGFCVSDQLLDRLERRRRVHGDDVRCHADARDGREIAQLIVGNLRVQGHGDGVRRDIRLEQRVSVRRRFGDERRAQHAGGAHPVFHYDLLAPQPREALGQYAPDYIGRGAGVERNDVTDGLARVILCPRRSRADPDRSRDRAAQPSPRSDHKHCAPPPIMNEPAAARPALCACKDQTVDGNWRVAARITDRQSRVAKTNRVSRIADHGLQCLTSKDQMMDTADQLALEKTVARSEKELVEQWLGQLDVALQSESRTAVAALFAPDGHWRDLLAFTWFITPSHGADDIAELMVAKQGTAMARGFAIAEGRTPPRRVVRAGTHVIEGIFRFETQIGRGFGVVRLLAEEPSRAFQLMTGLHELKGHEEKVGKRRPTGEAFYREFGGKTWKQQRVDVQAYADREPVVLIAGGGQAGLSLAATLGRIGVDTLVVDKFERVGDCWRQRYDSLALHNDTSFNHLLYMPFPPSWPTYLPKDMVADWFEAYAWAMEINFWTGTELVGGTYDFSAGRWNAVVRRTDGTERTLHPRHLVFANGLVGSPHIPELPGLKDFRGEVMHTTAFATGADWRG